MCNIIEEYEKWWLNELDTYHQNGFWDRIRIDETRGTNIKDISIILKKVKEVIKDYIGKPYGRIHSVTQMVTETIDFSNEDVFMKDLTLVLKPYRFNENPRISGSYSQSVSKYDEETDKMYDNRVTLFGESLQKFVIDPETLDETLWHELQHAYRQYCILKENSLKNTNSNPKIKNYDEAYGKSAECSLNYGGNWTKIRQMLYASDTNEIDSKMQEMIPYIEKHKEINFTNYKKYLKELPSYKFLMGFKSLLNDCEFYYNNKIGRNNMGIMLQYIYDENPKYSGLNWTKEHYSKVLYNRMKKMYLYAEHQFYKILYYTMEEYGRRNINEIALHTMPDELSVNETIEEHKKSLERMTKEMLPLDKLITF